MGSLIGFGNDYKYEPVTMFVDFEHTFIISKHILLLQCFQSKCVLNSFWQYCNKVLPASLSKVILTAMASIKGTLSIDTSFDETTMEDHPKETTPNKSSTSVVTSHVEYWRPTYQTTESVLNISCYCVNSSDFRAGKIARALQRECSFSSENRTN